MRAPQSIAELPETLRLFPLSRALLLPRTHRPLNIFEPRFVQMVDDALAGNRLIGLIQPQDTSQEAPQGAVPLQGTGCIGRITHFEEEGEERYLVVLEGVCRFTPGEDVAVDTPYRQIRYSAEPFSSDFQPGLGAQAVDRGRLVAMIHDYAEFAQFEVDFDEIERTDTEDLVNLCCMLSPYGAREKQALLEANTLSARAETLIALAEMEMAKAGPGTTLQ